MALFRIERDWYSLVAQINDTDRKVSQQARKVLRDSVLSSVDVFKAKPYFLSDEFSLVDATIAPVLWRLAKWEIDLTGLAQPISRYMNLVFSRPTFRHSLSRMEQGIRA
jgi:RNA polymerase-associated protein